MEAEQKLRDKIQLKFSSLSNLKEKTQNETKRIQQKLTELNGVIDNTQTLIERTKLFNSHMVKYDHILTSVASIYNLGIMIGNSTMGLSSAKSKKTENINTCEKVGVLCSRLSLTCAELKTRLNDDKKKIEFLTKEEKEILDTYLADTFGELTRSMDCAERMDIQVLSNIIANKIDIVDEIKDTLNRVEIREDIV